MAEISIQGADAVVRHLAAIPPELDKALYRALKRCGQLAVREAKRNAPKSPTKTQFSATLKRKKRTSRRTFTPGGLEKSIEYEVEGDKCSVFVGSNSFAGKYAKRIHDDRYKSWWDRGPGSIAKGTHAREKFIERAITDNESQFFAIIESETGKVIK